MKKSIMLGFVLSSVILLAACEGKKEDTVSLSTSSIELSTNSSTRETASSEKIETAIGKRSNPVPLGTTATVDTQYYT